MNLKEYEKKLRDLTHEELQKFNADFGGGRTEIDQRVRDFVDHPEHERRICQLLGLKTEAEKLTDAAINSANATTHNWLWILLKHPLFIGIICVTVTVVLGALLTAHLQDKRNLQAKQSELIKTFAELDKRQVQNLWHLHHAVKRNDHQDIKNFKLNNLDIISQYSGLIQEMKIYFKEEPTLIQNVKNITDLWHGVYTKIAEGKATNEFINQASKKGENIRGKIEFRVDNIFANTPGGLRLWQPDSSQTAIKILDASPEVMTLKVRKPKTDK